MGMNRIDHAAIRVNDMGEALAWYEGVLGLTVLERGADRAVLTCRGEAADVTLHAGGQSLVSFAFGVDNPDDLDQHAEKLKAHGVAFERKRLTDRPGTDEVLSFILPSGQQMELAVGSGGRVAGETDRVSDGTYRPTDLDHINLLGNLDPKEFSAFLRTVLGFKQSLSLSIHGAWVGSWLRSTKRDHDIAYMHAVAASDRLHHIAFAVEDGNHYFRLADRLVECGFRFEYGPGRHMGLPKSTTSFGTNNFAYAFDPSGNRNEFSSGMNEYPDDASLNIEIDPSEMADRMNGWALNMPESFMTVGS